MSKPQPIIFLDDAPQIPERFWRHIEHRLEAYNYPYDVVRLHDDNAKPCIDAGPNGIHCLLKDFSNTEGVPPADIEKARKWVGEFADYFGDTAVLLVE